MRNAVGKTFSRAINEIGKIVDLHFPFLVERSRKAFRRRVFRLRKRLLYRHVDTRQFFLLLQHLLASLHNAHTRLGQYPGRVWYRPTAHETRTVANKVFLWRNRQLLGSILSVDGRPVYSIVEDHVRRVSGSTTESRLHQAAKFALFTNHPGTATIRYRHRHELITLIVRRRRNRQIAPLDMSRYRYFRNNIGYWWIPSWRYTPAAVGKLERDIWAIKQHPPRVLVIDVRANGGGNGHVAGTVASHFFQRPTPFGSAATRVPGPTLRFKKRHFVIKPTPPFLSMPVVLLTGIECQSATEYFIAGIKDNGRAVIVGQRTGGGSANPQRFSVTFGRETFEIYVATWRYTRPNGRSLEGKGITPDVIVPLRPNDTIPRPLAGSAVTAWANIVLRR